MGKTRIFEKVRFSPMTSAWEKHVFLKKVRFSPMTSCLGKTRIFEKSAIFSKRYEFEKEWSRSFPSLFINMFFWLNKILHGLKMASQTLQTIRNGWAPEIKRLNDNLEKLEASLSGTDECVLDIYYLEETLQDKIHLLDAELTTIKADIVDLKNHLTFVIKELDVIKHDRGTTPPPSSPSGTFPQKYNLRSHVIDIE